MKTFILSGILLVSLPSFTLPPKDNVTLKGAWEFGDQDRMFTKIYSDKYFSVAIYSKKAKTFEVTAGGSWRIEGRELVETYEFHSAKPEVIGTLTRTPFSLKKDILVLKVSTGEEKWRQIDNGTPGKLGGAWLITGRMSDGKMTSRPPGPRKTMKILSGTRFQWIAFNVETKEFFGTGGGTYTTKDGKYTESIEFFSRDNSRVGADLQFDFSLENGQWRHKGLSSKGDLIDEVWSLREEVEK